VCLRSAKEGGEGCNSKKTASVQLKKNGKNRCLSSGKAKSLRSPSNKRTSNAPKVRQKERNSSQACQPVTKRKNRNTGKGGAKNQKSEEEYDVDEGRKGGSDTLGNSVWDGNETEKTRDDKGS